MVYFVQKKTYLSTVKFATLSIFIFRVFFCQSQTVFSEPFDEADNSTTGTDNTAGAVTWAASCPGSIATTDYFKVVSGKLTARDTNGPAATFTTASIDISTCTLGLEISFDLEEAGNMEQCSDCGGTGIGCIDWVKLEYNVDGLGWNEVASTSCAGTMTEAPGQMVQIGDILGGGPITINSACIDFGTSLLVRITCMSWAGSEYWYMDNITVSCLNCVLPVELVNFEAERNLDESTSLNWTTLSERENDFFEIQMSYDGLNFETIHTMDGAGNSSSTIDYSYTDNTPHPIGVVYYRLKQVDYNGGTNYSETNSIYVKTKAIIELIDETLYFSVPDHNEYFLHLNIYDLKGSLVLQIPFKDAGSILWDKKGFYIVEIPELEFRKKLISSK